jgi:hypothetical protein
MVISSESSYDASEFWRGYERCSFVRRPELLVGVVTQLRRYEKNDVLMRKFLADLFDALISFKNAEFKEQMLRDRRKLEAELKKDEEVYYPW